MLQALCSKHQSHVKTCSAAPATGSDRLAHTTAALQQLDSSYAALHAELVAEWPSALDGLAERINLQDLQGAQSGRNGLHFDSYAGLS